MTETIKIEVSEEIHDMLVWLQDDCGKIAYKTQHPGETTETYIDRLLHGSYEAKDASEVISDLISKEFYRHNALVHKSDIPTWPAPNIDHYG